ncbi:hypothetical protein [Aquisphaera giovannonii]|nr:hypothetical protein [Aquisphaera giovannonii]
MAQLHEFLDGLLREGNVVFRSRPGPAEGPSAEVTALLAEAYETHRLDVAGPAIPFDAGVACEAAEVVRQACWAMVNQGDRVEDLAARVAMRRTPGGPSQHLSADLLLRYLPGVHRRARASGPDDPLVGMLAEVLRRWPLSGVLAGLEEPPLTPTNLGGHPGLLMLYAERYAARGRPAWEPERAGKDYLELVRQAAGRGASPEGGGGDGRQRG